MMVAYLVTARDYYRGNSDLFARYKIPRRWPCEALMLGKSHSRPPAPIKNEDDGWCPMR
jgi:hypothetical protein